jgi:transcriptional regulator with XRE-family HTH domain
MSNRIAEIRRLRGLSQAKLAELVGTSQAEISRLENGERELTENWMRRLAHVLEVEPADLLASAIAEIRGDDVEPYFPDASAELAEPLRRRNLAYYRVKTDAVALAGHVTGTVILVDMSEAAIEARKTGDVLLVQVSGAGEQKICARLLRLYVAPRLLTTNRLGRNPSFGLDEPGFGVEIKGVIVAG